MLSTGLNIHIYLFMSPPPPVCFSAARAGTPTSPLLSTGGFGNHSPWCPWHLPACSWHSFPSLSTSRFNIFYRLVNPCLQVSDSENIMKWPFFANLWSFLLYFEAFWILYMFCPFCRSQPINVCFILCVCVFRNNFFFDISTTWSTHVNVLGKYPYE